MPRFSKLFWFTVLPGTLASALFSAGLRAFLSLRLDAALALCGQPKLQGCLSYDMTDQWLYAFVPAELIGNPLLFWLAFKLGRKWLSLAPPVATDAAP